jgi:tRNA (guanine-N7-)-methyltransferase
LTHPRGRLTHAQRRGLQEVLPAYVVAADVNSTSGWFGREAPLGVEIGFGMGDALCDWASDAPDWNLLGIDIYDPGIGALANRLSAEGIANVRVVQARAEEFVAERLPASSVDEFRVFFPDPWPKKRHHKRRLIQPSFATLMAERLKVGGLVWFVTDWTPYAEWALDVFDKTSDLVPRGNSTMESSTRSETKFERRGLRLGHVITELVYIRAGPAGQT